MQFFIEHFAGDAPTDSVSDNQQSSNSQLSSRDPQTMSNRDVSSINQ